MKIFDTRLRLSVNAALALALLFCVLIARAEAHPAGHDPAVISKVEKHVNIKVEIHGKIDGHTADAVEDLIADWLEEAHFVVEEKEGANFLKLHVVLKVTENNHFAIHEDCGDWQEEKEAAVLDALDEILHHMISDFIEKFGHE